MIEGKDNMIQQRIMSDVVRSSWVTWPDSQSWNSGGTLRLIDFKCLPFPLFGMLHPYKVRLGMIMNIYKLISLTKHLLGVMQNLDSQLRRKCVLQSF